MKQIITFLTFLTFTFSPLFITHAHAKDGFSAVISLGSGVNGLQSGGSSGVLPDDDGTDEFYTDIEISNEEWEKNAGWDNTALAGQYRQGKNAVEIESFNASTDKIALDVKFKYAGETSLRTLATTIQYEFSGTAFSYIYYPEISADAKLQPFMKFGRTAFTETTTVTILNTEDKEEVSAPGSVFGGGFEYSFNESVSLLVGTKLYSATEGSFYAFNDLGVRVNF